MLATSFGRCSPRVSRVSVPVLIAVISCLSNIGLAQDWVASTGTPDSGSTALVKFNDGNAGIAKGGPAATTVTLRYNIVPAGIPGPDLVQGECRQLVVRFLDNGPAAQVTLSLKQYNLQTGVITTLLTFDSENAPASDLFQMSPSACVAFDFRFASNAAFLTVPAEFFNVYYVEA